MATPSIHVVPHGMPLVHLHSGAPSTCGAGHCKEPCVGTSRLGEDPGMGNLQVAADEGRRELLTLGLRTLPPLQHSNRKCPQPQSCSEFVPTIVFRDSQRAGRGGAKIRPNLSKNCKTAVSGQIFNLAAIFDKFGYPVILKILRS